MTARDAVGAAVDALTAAGVETPRLDAELLIADALGVDRAALVVDPSLAVPGAAARLIGERVRRRVAREPVAYILGVKGFRRIELLVDSRVLIPRPETELLVEVALSLPAGAHVHDVGTGSGAVALALRDERPDLVVSASDASPDAVAVARANGLRCGRARRAAGGRVRPRRRQPALRARGRVGGAGARDPAVGAARGAGGGGRRARRDPVAGGPGARPACGWRWSTHPGKRKRSGGCCARRASIPTSPDFRA